MEVRGIEPRSAKPSLLATTCLVHFCLPSVQTENEQTFSEYPDLFFSIKQPYLRYSIQPLLSVSTRGVVAHFGYLQAAIAGTASPHSTANRSAKWAPITAPVLAVVGNRLLTWPTDQPRHATNNSVITSKPFHPQIVKEQKKRSGRGKSSFPTSHTLVAVPVALFVNILQKSPNCKF